MSIWMGLALTLVLAMLFGYVMGMLLPPVLAIIASFVGGGAIGLVIASHVKP